MLAVLLGLCLASAGSGCCLAMTGQGFDPCDNESKPDDAHPCLAGLKRLVWPWGRHNEGPAYSQFHPVPCSPALLPRSELASGAEPPGLLALPATAGPPAPLPTPPQGVPPVLVPEPEKIPVPAGSSSPATKLPAEPATKLPADGAGNQTPPQSGGTNHGAQAASATTWIFRQSARPVSAADQTDGRTASGPERTVR